jgi:hypothetical protein
LTTNEPGGELVADPSTLRCFVIGPIGNRLAEHGSSDRQTYEEALKVFSEVIEPACSRVGLINPVRADGLARAGEITDQIFRRLRDDDVVIADLTGANANVMYELGLRHSKNRFTAQIGEYGRLPFDINVIRTVMFSRSSMGLINARDELVQILETGLLGEYDPVSATRVWIEIEGLPVPTSQENPAALVESEVSPLGGDNDAPGFVDLVAEAEDRYEDFNTAVVRLNAVVERLGELAETASAEVDQSDARGAGMKGRLVVATKYATGLASLADELDAVVLDYADAFSAVSRGTLALIGRLEEDPSQLGKPEVEGFTSSIRNLARITRESLGSLSGMTSIMIDNAKISRVMRAPTRRVTDALDRFSDVSQSIDEWDRRLQALGVPMPSTSDEVDDAVEPE